MFEQQLIFIPLLLLVLLTLCVWITLYITRIRYMKQQRIHPQRLATDTESRPLMQAVAGPSENFTNLLETPVLFYVACITAFVTHQVDSLLFGFAIFYVALRSMHSFIHCTYNRVMHRFFFYIVSSIALWLMWGLLAFRLLVG